ncbi:MAG: ATPase [Spirochaetales bacterium]|nr:ATPase [Spirochaetales bacterium]
MIEKMKKIIVVAPQEHKLEMINGIRDLGVIHISETAAPDSALSDKLLQLNRIRSVLAEQPKVEKKAPITGAAFDALNQKLVAAIDEKKALSDEVVKMDILRESISKWGEFDPSDVRFLKENGIELSFYLIDSKEIENLPKHCEYIALSSIEKRSAIAVVGKPLPEKYNASRFHLPEKGVKQLADEAAAKRSRIEELGKFIASSASMISSYDKEIVRTTDEIVFNSVSEGAGSQEGLTLISGFIPAADLEAFKKAAKKNCWAYALDDPTEEDPVPTKVTFNKATRMMKPVFDMLGTVPGYREYDISTWFMLFFALFFAMIIGDAAYGMIFLAVAVVLNIKLKKVNNIVLLLYVTSIATVFWGAVTGTWFGTEAAMKVPFFRSLVIPAIANYPEYFGLESTTVQNSVMKFCFSIGAVQLSLACVMNVVRKWKERSLALVADFAWLVMIISIYFLALMLVIGAQINVSLVFAVIVGGLVLVILFGAQENGKSFGKGVLAGLGGAFTTFLDTISAFGNVMSYIRLFAVGMASLAISQSFNGMASPMLRGWALPAGILILVIGHGLNLIMGLLSVVVHGVRLNLLEFSGQLGMEWAGIPYEPFKKND